MPFDPTLDPIAILATLGITNVTAITPVAGGNATSIWRVDDRSGSYALRVLHVGQTETYNRELAAMEAAHQAHLPVPLVHATGLWQEHPVMLLSWCTGFPLAVALYRQPWRFWVLGQAFGRTQAQIHQIQAPAYLAQQGADWIRWAGAEEQELQILLQKQAGQASALIHLDYHPLNVLTDGRQITAILDWANARSGDPRADIARTYTILRVEPNVPGRQPLFLSLFRRLFTWSWQRGYQQVSGPLGNLAPFYAWAGAVMVRDLAPRVANPDSWWQPHHLAQIQTWSNQWQQRAFDK